MSWQDRTEDSIYLISPSGSGFAAFWVGNKRSMKKKLGIFEYPKVRGAIIQDLDVGPAEYPITLYFEGPDNDLAADAFFKTCRERGPWSVAHPVLGLFTLQLVSVSSEIQPVTSGNMTVVEAEFIEPRVNINLLANAQNYDDLTIPIAAASSSAYTQFVNKVDISKPSFLARLIAAVMSAIAFVAKVSASIFAVVAAIYSVVSTIMGIITAAVMAVASLAGAIQALIALPGQIIGDIKSKLNYYSNILSAAFGLCPSTPSAEGINSLALVELISTSCIIGMVQAVQDTDFGSRAEALDTLSTITQSFNSMIARLDAAQALYAGNSIDTQYFSQSDAYTDLLALMQAVWSYLLTQSWDLSVAKYITLTKDRAPIEIALTEGVDFDGFISCNKLKGDNILLLPAGTQVVVYL